MRLTNLCNIFAVAPSHAHMVWATSHWRCHALRQMPLPPCPHPCLQLSKMGLKPPSRKTPSYKDFDPVWQWPLFGLSDRGFFRVFLTKTSMAIPRSHGLVFLSLFWPGTPVTISWTQSVRPGYGHWCPSLNYQKKTGLTDSVVAIGVKKTRSVRPRCGQQSY